MRCTKREFSGSSHRSPRPAQAWGLLLLLAFAVSACAPAPLSAAAPHASLTPTTPTTSTSVASPTPEPTVTTLPAPSGPTRSAGATTRPGQRPTPTPTATARPTAPVPSRTETVPPPLPTGVQVDATGHVETAFATTSGGIVCAVSAEGPQARCDVEGSTWSTPPAPSDCQGRWGGGVLLTSRGATLSCITDTVLADAASGGAGTWWESLPAARTVTRTGGRQEVSLTSDATVVAVSGSTRLTCRSDGTSVTCAVGTARFTVSRASYSLR